LIERQRVDIPKIRLANHRLLAEKFEAPADAVRWLGAVQAQDFHGAKWSLAQRCRQIDNAALDAQFNAGELIRTHTLRPTWHFLAPEDLGWIQALTGPRVHQANGTQYRMQGITPDVARRARRIIEKTLARERVATRNRLAAALADGGLPANGVRLAYLVMHAELEAVICSGPLDGKQFTYALVDDRVKHSRTLSADEALSELGLRYFQSHGPATAKDFSKWSGLTLSSAHRAIEILGQRLAPIPLNGERYWWTGSTERAPKLTKPVVHLLSIYDELLIGYRNYDLSHPAELRSQLSRLGPSATTAIVLNGLMIGVWSRAQTSKEVKLTCTALRPLRRSEKKALEQSAAAYAAFLRLKLVLRFTPAK